MSHRAPVLVYDPNSQNPYGRELAHVASLTGRDVIRFGVRGGEGVPGVANRLVLARPMNDQRSFRGLFDRVLGPFRVLVAFFVHRESRLVVAWTRDAFDLGLLGGLALLSGRVMVVLHNPSSVRHQKGVRGTLERAVVARCRVIVHSKWLAASLERRRRVQVADHPPYLLSTHGVSRSSSRTSGDIVAFVGSMRPDKGAADLVSIARASGLPWTLFVLGPDRLPSETESSLRALGVDVAYPASMPPSDSQLAGALVTSTVMLAPYRDVTTSGSVVLAATLGVEVIGYSSESGMREALDSSALAESPEALGALLRTYLAEPWATHRVEAQSLLERAVRSWGEVLD